MASAEEAAAMKTEIQRLAGLLEGMERRLTGGGQSSEQKLPMSMTARKQFSSLPPYSGKAEEFGGWKFKTMRFLSEEEIFVQFVQALEEEGTVDITEEQLERFRQKTNSTVEGIRWLNNQLYQVLSLNCVGDAATTVQNLESAGVTVRGAKAWMTLVNEHEGKSGQRMSALINRVFEPDRAKRYKETKGAVEAWETRMKEYTKLTTEAAMPEMAKIFAVKKVVPLELAKDIQRQSNSLTTYNLVKEYIMEQVAARKDAWFEDLDKRPNNHQGVAPMELDNMQERESEEDAERREDTMEKIAEAEATLLALRGQMPQWPRNGAAGNGKGFSGNCNHCGKYGHRMAECRIKDEEMQKYRAEKGGTKGNPWGGKGQFQGGWGKGGEKEDMGEVRVKVTRDGMEDNRDGMGVKKEERGLGRREVQKGDCIGSMKVAHHRQSKADGRRKDPGMVKDVCSIWFQSPQDWSSRMPSRT